MLRIILAFLTAPAKLAKAQRLVNEIMKGEGMSTEGKELIEKLREVKDLIDKLKEEMEITKRELAKYKTMVGEATTIVEELLRKLKKEG